MRNATLFCLAALLAGALAGCASSAEREAEQEKTRKLVETHVMLGSGYLQRGQLDVAKEELGKALRAAPDDSQANNIMGVLQWRLKYYAEAERHFRRALENDGKNASAHHNYGAFLCDRGQVDQSLRYFRAAADDPLYPYAAEVNLNAGVCLMKKPAPMAAEKYFREALRLNPRLPGALHQMARISWDSGQPLSARGFIERFLQTAEDTPEILLLAVKVERALHNKNAEASYAVRLRGKFPTSPEVAQLQALSTPKKK